MPHLVAHSLLNKQLLSLEPIYMSKRFQSYHVSYHYVGLEVDVA